MTADNLDVKFVMCSTFQSTSILLAGFVLAQRLAFLKSRPAQANYATDSDAKDFVNAKSHTGKNLCSSG